MMNDFVDHEQATLVKQPGDPVEEAATLPPSSPATEPASTAAKIGLPQLPGFLLEKELGRGGMGVVYLARQVRLNRLVALKMIISGDHANEETKLRFLAEAEAIAKLHHPGIVQVHEFGTHDNNPYFALEYISGGSLDKKLAGNPLPPREAADLVEKLARAVQSAHDAGIIHRDLKPANILLDTPSSSAGEGSGVRGSAGFAPKITDFGLVKNVGSDMTATGQILGTPSYMAPEQADGKKSVGPAADIYALGAILYECLTGRAPFKAATPLDTILQVVNDEPVSVRQLQAKTPMDLETICHKCLQKDPGKRYGSATELAEDLGRYLRHEPIAARPVGRVEKVWRWCRRYPVVACLLVASLLGGISSLLFSVWAFVEKDRADQQASVATEKTIVAQLMTDAVTKEKMAVLAEKQRADDQLKKTQRLLGISRAERGLQLLDEGQLHRGLLYCADSLLVEPDNKNSELMVRNRFANYRRERDQIRLSVILKHSSPVRCSSFSSDGKRVLSASSDGLVRFWDTSTGKPITLLIQHGDSLSWANFSVDGKKVITAGGKHARVWDATTGLPLTPPLTHRGGIVLHASISPDGNRVVTSASDLTARVWDANNGKPITPPLNHARFVNHASFRTDGQQIVTACKDGSVQIWKVDTGQPLGPPMKHQDSVNCACFSPDGSRVLTASDDNTARQWDATTGKQVTFPLRHDGQVSHASFSTDGRYILTASHDKTARVWNAATGQPLSPPMKHLSYVYYASFSNDGRYVVTGSLDSTARIWNAITGQFLAIPLQHQAAVRCVSFSQDGRRVVTASTDHTARIWEIVPEQSLSITLAHDAYVKSAFFDGDDKRIVTASGDGTARIWDGATGQLLTPSLNHRGPVNLATFSNDGKYVVTASADKTARVWVATTGKPLTPPLLHNGSVNHATFSNDGKYVATASSDKTARIWLAATGLPFTSTLKHQGAVNHTSFSNGGTYLVTASDDKTAQVWQVTSDPTRLKLQPYRHANSVTSASFSADNKRIVTSSVDQSAAIWVFLGQSDVRVFSHEAPVRYASLSKNGKWLVTTSEDSTAKLWYVEPPQYTRFVAPTTLQAPVVLNHKGIVHYANFTKDCERVVTASSDGTARVWSVATGQPLTPPLKHQGAVYQATFSNDGKFVVTASGDNAAHVWNISSVERPIEDVVRHIQVIASHTLDEAGAMRPLDVETELIPWFQELKAKYPADFSITPQQARAWRENEIAQCMKEGNLPAAFFHRDWLIAEMVQEAAKSKK